MSKLWVGSVENFVGYTNPLQLRVISNSAQWGASKGASKIYGAPGPGLSTGKKRGRRLFFSEKTGGAEFSSAKKRGRGVCMTYQKRGINTFFQGKVEAMFLHPKIGHSGLKSGPKLSLSITRQTWTLGS